MTRPAIPHRRAGGRGFTLLEALVTLVIVALIVTLLMQALQQSLDLRVRLLRHQSEARVAGLQEQWFRESVAGAVADLPDAMGSMQGRPDSLALVTLEPVAAQGVARVRWWLEPVDGGHALHYADAEWEDITVVPGPLDQARFHYLGPDGNWTDRWEPGADDAIVLPRLVRLSAVTADGQLEWWVPLLADPRVPLMLRPLDPGASGL